MTIKTPVYMDYHATTPVDPRVLDEMLPYFSQEFGNAASIDHIYGNRALEAVEKARKQASTLINAKPEEIIFTSGATESDNIAIQGILEQYKEKGNHIITCVTEHKAVLDTCKHLENKGIKVTYLPVDKYGLINLEELENAITDKTILISVMAANNEIGTIAPISEIGAIAHKHEVIFHTDAAQAIGHIPMDVQKMNIDIMSISGHKIYGPKGIGALYVRRSKPVTKVSPIIFGGGHEKGIRSGTLNVPGIVGLGSALEIAKNEMNKEVKLHKKWTNKMLQEFQLSLRNIKLNGHPEKRLAHNLNICFNGVDGKAIINLVKNDIAISTGSACTNLNVQPSHVLKAIGLSDNEIYSTIRFGLGRFNTEEEMKYSIDKIITVVAKLHKIK